MNQQETVDSQDKGLVLLKAKLSIPVPNVGPKPETFPIQRANTSFPSRISSGEPAIRTNASERG